MENTNRKRESNFKKKILPKIWVFFCVFAICATMVAAFSQEQKLREIRAQHAQKTEELNQLKLEQKRKQDMLEYVKSNEYLLQYAREKLGLIGEDDVKFKINEEN